MKRLTSEELERYSRQMLLPGVGGKGQARLASASVLVLGAGGLGSPVLQYLAASGVGRLGIVDPDVVERSNLGRQVIYRVSDLGRPKSHAAAEALRSLNPHVECVPIQQRATPENLPGLAEGYDLLIDGSDSYAAKFAVNDEAMRSGRACVIGAAVGYAGQVMVVDGPGFACYRCLFEEEPPPEVAQSCQDAGILGPVAGVIGSLQAMEALRLLLGLRLPPPAGEGVILQFDGRLREIRFERRAGCTACGKTAGPGTQSLAGAGRSPVNGSA